MNTESLEHFKTKLLNEKTLLEKELKTVGRINPDNPDDWEAKPQSRDIDQAERNEVADRVEGFETNTAILNTLEIKFNEVKDALERIENGTYGICSVCGKEIEEERLEANPAATTCMTHL
ncbi:MAG: TraR/DksA C4-type zinc finger protein [Candidatus Paceibacterota bacterium]|jgi:RNA polymerase-binding transcription factor DksA